LFTGAAAAVLASYATKWWPVYPHNDNVYMKLTKFDSRIVNLTKGHLGKDCLDTEYARRMVVSWHVCGRYCAVGIFQYTLDIYHSSVYNIIVYHSAVYIMIYHTCVKCIILGVSGKICIQMQQGRG